MGSSSDTGAISVSIQDINRDNDNKARVIPVTRDNKRKGCVQARRQRERLPETVSPEP